MNENDLRPLSARVSNTEGLLGEIRSSIILYASCRVSSLSKYDSVSSKRNDSFSVCIYPLIEYQLVERS